jgi:hypothetical protein
MLEFGVVWLNTASITSIAFQAWSEINQLIKHHHHQQSFG